ncbi:MAG: NADH-ubiquinone oxidoreductase-F iron-sulfur binding region domain-containing protein [Edaphobacter sp.]
MYNGGGSKKDVDNVQYLAENMLGRTFCPLGDAAAMPTLGVREEIPQRVLKTTSQETRPVRRSSPSNSWSEHIDECRSDYRARKKSVTPS